MNEQMCQMILAGLDPALDPRQERTLRDFAGFMDHHSVWITGHAIDNGTLKVLFSDDRRRYRLTIDEMAHWFGRMDRGEPFPWDALAEPEGDVPASTSR